MPEKKEKTMPLLKSKYNVIAESLTLWYHKWYYIQHTVGTTNCRSPQHHNRGKSK